MSNRFTNVIAIGLLALIFFIAFFSILNDTFTFDETAHVASGYSYLTQKDFRLNPEHPPLIKDLAAVPLLFLNLNFPKTHPSWTQEKPIQWWFQFDFAAQFLYNSDNDPDKILLFSRMPMILVLLLLGWLVFHWTRKLGGNLVSLFCLFLFALSPTLLAHGRLVTTDVGATLGVVLATFFYLKFLKNPKKLNIFLAGLTLGTALLLKFSCILLLPFFAVNTLVYAVLSGKQKGISGAFKNIFRYTGLALLILVTAALLIWLVYQFHIWNYPAEKQIENAKILLSTNPSLTLVKTNILMMQNKVFRPFGQYLLGLSMATQRVAGGNTTYFMGGVSTIAWPLYFPIVYFLKIPLVFHILTLIAIAFAFFTLFRLKFQVKKKVLNWIKNHFTEFSMLIFLAIYWTTSITNNLNIGIRHLLPVFPFTYILVCLSIKNGYQKLKNIPLKKIVILILLVLLGWYGFSSLRTFPHYISYFNEIAGGSKNGYKFAVDSNYDWGQDLKRLKNWVENPPAGGKVNKIYVDYFGGGDVHYYLGEKYIRWEGTKSPNEFPKGNYLAVSATLLQGGRGIPAKGFNQPTDYYNWLNNYQPIARPGYSIFIYYID